MSQTDQTTDDVLNSLTGHEEMWILEQIGRPVGALIPEPGMYRRALIFVLKRREQVAEDDARNAVLDMPMKEVLEFFAEDSDEDEPVAEPGKGETPVDSEPLDGMPSEPLRMISQPSAS